MEEYRIIKALFGFYYVLTEDGVVECRARGRFRRQDQSPLVGDFVRITRQGAGKGVLEELLPRKNAFIRPAVANIAQLVVLASCAVAVSGCADGLVAEDRTMCACAFCERVMELGYSPGVYASTSWYR